MSGHVDMGQIIFKWCFADAAKAVAFGWFGDKLSLKSFYQFVAFQTHLISSLLMQFEVGILIFFSPLLYDKESTFSSGSIKAGVK